MKNDETKLIKTLSRELILDLSPFLKVEKHRVGIPDGRIVEGWPWLISPNFVCVVVLTEDEKFLVFRQAKYAVHGSTLAPVGGYIEENEAPVVAAKRELMEEAGYQSSHWENLGQFAVDGNRGNGVAYFFLARDAVRVAEPNADDLEEQEILLLSRAEVEAAVARGAFKVLPWQAIMALALLRV
jgi:ADP-ribose pyrophosphatase